MAEKKFDDFAEQQKLGSVEIEELKHWILEDPQSEPPALLTKLPPQIDKLKQ